MKLSPVVVEWAKAYEREHGNNPPEKALQIMEHIVIIGDQVSDLGKKDAAQRCAPRTADFFRELFGKVFGDGADQKTVEDVADLRQMDYLDGYKGGKAK